MGKTDRLVLEQTYHLSDFRFSDDGTYGDNRIAGNPVQSYKAEIRYEHPSGLYIGPNVEWNIVKYPVDEANSLFADARSGDDTDSFSPGNGPAFYGGVAWCR